MTYIASLLNNAPACRTGLSYFNVPAVACVALASFAYSPCMGQEATENRRIDTVIVTATLEDSLMAECPSTVSVIDAATIEELGALSVDQILEEVPGLSVEMNSGRVNRPTIRGTNAQQTLVLIDGRRQAPGFRRMSDLNQILAGGIERIEVVRGPVSSLYGSEAIGGVVNIITKKAPRGEAEGMLSTYYGGGKYDEYAATVSGGAKIGVIEAYGSVGYRCNNEIANDAGTMSWPDEVTVYGGFVNVGAQLGANTKLSAGALFSDSERIGYRAQNGGSRRDADDQRIGGHIQLSQSIGDSTQLVLRTYVERYDCDISMTSSKGTTYSEMRNELAVLDGHVSAEICSVLSATIGGELRRESYDDFSDDEDKDEMDNQAVFAQFNWSPLEALNVVFGGRIDHYEVFGSHGSPQLSAIYQLSDEWSIRGGYGCGFRAPNSMELNIETTESQGKITVLPNSALDPESSETFELGLRRTGAFWTFGMTVFHTEVEDMIEQETVAKNTTQWTNLSSVSIDGVEIENTLRFNKNITVENFVCWLDPVNDDTGFHVEGKQRWYTQTALIGRMPAWGLSGRVSVRFGSDEWGVDDSEEDSDEVVDLRIEKSFLKRWKVYVGARDVTASDHVDRRYYTGVNVRF